MKVSFHGSVQAYTSGKTSLDLEGAQSVRMLIDLLSGQYGARFAEYLLGDGTCFFLVNGSSIIQTGGLDTPLNQGDRVEILPFVDGG